jgi:hypothetical protein
MTAADAVLGPEQVEQAIKQVSERIARGVRVCSNTYREFLEADRQLDHDFAKAYVDHNGPAHEKRYAAELATFEARRHRDECDAAYRYADRQARALELELRALQSVGASVRAMYAVAGRG